MDYFDVDSIVEVIDKNKQKIKDEMNNIIFDNDKLSKEGNKLLQILEYSPKTRYADKDIVKSLPMIKLKPEEKRVIKTSNHMKLPSTPNINSFLFQEKVVNNPVNKEVVKEIINTTIDNAVEKKENQNNNDDKKQDEEDDDDDDDYFERIRQQREKQMEEREKKMKRAAEEDDDDMGMKGQRYTTCQDDQAGGQIKVNYKSRYSAL